MDGRKATRRDHAELLGAVALYALVLTGSLVLLRDPPAEPFRTLVGVSPMLPFLLAVWAILRQVRRIDAYQRLKVMEDIAVAAALTTAGATFTYGFLENAGWPPLSMFAVWPFMGMVWALRSVLRAVLEARAMPRE